jgi:hypothetical protein
MFATNTSSITLLAFSIPCLAREDASQLLDLFTAHALLVISPGIATPTLSLFRKTNGTHQPRHAGNDHIFVTSVPWAQGLFSTFASTVPLGVKTSFDCVICYRFI